MPEGDTVWRTARHLDQALSGQTLTGCDIRVPAYATVDLSGQVVQETVSRGKHLLTRIGADHIEGASHWLDGHYADSADSWMAGDGLHPNDTGYAHLAEQMDAALGALDPPL